MGGRRSSALVVCGEVGVGMVVGGFGLGVGGERETGEGMGTARGEEGVVLGEKMMESCGTKETEEEK